MRPLHSATFSYLHRMSMSDDAPQQLLREIIVRSFIQKKGNWGKHNPKWVILDSGYAVNLEFGIISSVAADQP